MRSAALGALSVVLWNASAFAQGAPPPPAPMVVPGATAPAPPPPTGAAPAPPPGWVLAPTPAAPPATAAPAPPPPRPTATYAADPATAGQIRPYDPYQRRPLVLEGHLSFGGPMGWFGAAVDYSPSRYFGIGAGGGLGDNGLQLGAMARLRLPFDTVSAGFGAGVSGGPYEDRFFRDDGHHWDTAYWLNTEGFFEFRRRQGLMIRPYIGTGALLNPSDGKPIQSDYRCAVVNGNASCATYSTTREINPFLFYMGVAVGYAFEILRGSPFPPRRRHELQARSVPRSPP